MQQKMIIHDQEDRIKNQEEHLNQQEAAIMKLTRMMQKEVTQFDEEIVVEDNINKLVLLTLFLSSYSLMVSITPTML